MFINAKCKAQNIRIQNSGFRIKIILSFCILNSSFCIFDAFAWSKSVSRILFFEKIQRGNHSSRLFVAKQLKRPTRKRRPIARRARAGNSHYRFPIWSCTARSLPSRACYHARCCALTATFHPSPFPAGLFSVALVVALLKKKAPGRYPARRPSVFGLSSPEKISAAIARLAPILQGWFSLTKNVQQNQAEFIKIISCRFRPYLRFAGSGRQSFLL